MKTFKRTEISIIVYGSIITFSPLNHCISLCFFWKLRKSFPGCDQGALSTNAKRLERKFTEALLSTAFSFHLMKENKFSSLRYPYADSLIHRLETYLHRVTYSMFKIFHVIHIFSFFKSVSIIALQIALPFLMCRGGRGWSISILTHLKRFGIP